MKISKESDNYVVEFRKSKNVEGFQTYSIRFSNSGSRYREFSVLFMKMYKSILNFEEHRYIKQKTLNR